MGYCLVFKTFIAESIFSESQRIKANTSFLAWPHALWKTIARLHRGVGKLWKKRKRKKSQKKSSVLIYCETRSLEKGSFQWSPAGVCQAIHVKSLLCSARSANKQQSGWYIQRLSREPGKLILHPTPKAVIRVSNFVYQTVILCVSVFPHAFSLANCHTPMRSTGRSGKFWKWTFETNLSNPFSSLSNPFLYLPFLFSSFFVEFVLLSILSLFSYIFSLDSCPSLTHTI